MAVSVTGISHNAGTSAASIENEDDDAGMLDTQKLWSHEPLSHHTTERGVRGDIKQLLEQVVKLCGEVFVAKVNPFPHPSP